MTDVLKSALQRIVDQGGIVGAILVVCLVGGGIIVWRMYARIVALHDKLETAQEERLADRDKHHKAVMDERERSDKNRVEDASRTATAYAALAKESVASNLALAEALRNQKASLDAHTAALRDLKNKVR